MVKTNSQFGRGGGKQFAAWGGEGELQPQAAHRAFGPWGMGKGEANSYLARILSGRGKQTTPHHTVGSARRRRVERLERVGGWGQKATGEARNRSKVRG